MKKRPAFFATFLSLFVFAFLNPKLFGQGFPSQEDLKRTNVSLRISGFIFTSGLNEDGTPNGNGVELMPVAWGGSGFIIDKDGTLLTAYHVARRAQSCEAHLESGEIFRVEHIKTKNSQHDLAVLKLRGAMEFPRVNLGNSDEIRPLDKVLAVGNTFGRGLNQSTGEVTRLNTDDNGQLVGIIHSAPIAGGNSGGALYKGKKVIGVNVRGVPGYTYNVAMPINIARALIAGAQGQQNILLQNAFPTNLGEISQKAELISGTPGEVAGKSGNEPALRLVRIDFLPLVDYLILLETEPGKQLDLAIIDQNRRYIGSGGPLETGGNRSAVFITQDNYQPAIIAVLNSSASPAGFALGVYRINW